MCLDDLLFGTCSSGTCVNGSCVCVEGFQQSDEFLYIDVAPGDVVICDYSPVVMSALAAVVFVVTLVTFFIQAYVIENRKQFRRIAIGLLGFVCALVAMPMRIDRVDESIFGFDFVYTLFFANATGLLLVQYMIFLNKYIEYMLRFFTIHPYVRKWAQFTVYMQYVMAGLIFVSHNIFVATVFIEDNETNYALVLTFGVCNTIFHSYAALNDAILLTKYINDLKLITRKSGEARIATREKFVARCKKIIPRVRLVRLACGGFSVFAAFQSSLFLIGPVAIKRYLYFMFVNFILYDIAALIVIRANYRERKLRGRLKRPLVVSLVFPQKGGATSFAGSESRVQATVGSRNSVSLEGSSDAQLPAF